VAADNQDSWMMALRVREQFVQESEIVVIVSQKYSAGLNGIPQMARVMDSHQPNIRVKLLHLSVRFNSSQKGVVV
jgi:hypothetical protein